MAEPENREPRDLPAGASDEGQQLGLLLSSTQAMIDEEFRRAERIDGKSRNQFAAVGAFFAVVMATTAAMFNALQDNHQKLAGWVAPTTGGLACASVIAVALALGVSVHAWRTREQDALDSGTIRDYVPYAEHGNMAVGKRLIEAYTDILDDRRAQNRQRVADMKAAMWWCVGAGGVAALQLASIFVAAVTR